MLFHKYSIVWMFTICIFNCSCSAVICLFTVGAGRWRGGRGKRGEGRAGCRAALWGRLWAGRCRLWTPRWGRGCCTGRAGGPTRRWRGGEHQDENPATDSTSGIQTQRNNWWSDYDCRESSRDNITGPYRYIVFTPRYFRTFWRILKWQNTVFILLCVLLQASCYPPSPPRCTSLPSWACAPGGLVAAHLTHYSSAASVCWWPSSAQDTSPCSTSTSSSSSKNLSHLETVMQGLSQLHTCTHGFLHFLGL